MPIRIAIDTMGGDFGPGVIIRGALQYLLDDRSEDSELIFVGPEDIVRECLHDLQVPEQRVSVQHAGDVIAMDAPPTDGLRKKKSSLVVAHKLLKNREVEAVVSTGNTGAVMASAMFNLGRLEGVSRPAIASVFPTSTDRPCLVLDVGANSDCKPNNLLEFAHMGSIFFSNLVDEQHPRVALLSIGEESNKGNDITIHAHRQLSRSSLNFIGNIEGRDVLKGKSDVVVCDGFVGNVLLKFTESVHTFIFDKFKRQVSTNIFSRMGTVLMAPFLGRLKKAFDYSQYGGAPLLGINGVTIICHGSSNALAVMNGIKVAREMVAKKVNYHIKERLSAYYSPANAKGNGRG